MSLERMQAKVLRAIDDSKLDKPVACALLNDFFRTLHEVHYKSGCNLGVLSEQIEGVLGLDVATSMLRAIDEKTSTRHREPSRQNGRLGSMCQKFSAERGTSLPVVAPLFSSTIRALDEERRTVDGGWESVIFLAYWSIGDEAAYHVAGIHNGGDTQDLCFEELKYLDGSLRRYRTTVERWDFEMAWERASKT